MATDNSKSIQSFDIADISGGCNYSDDLTALTKTQSPDSLNVEFFNGRLRKRLGETAINTPPTGQGGIDSFTKLMLHMDGTDGGTTFVDSSTSAKTVTNTETYDVQTSLMLHMNGVNGSTVFTDSSVNSLTATAQGTVHLDTSTKKFGTAAANFSASGDGISYTANPAFVFAAGDFTIEAQVYFSSLMDTQILFCQRDDTNNSQICVLNPTSGTITFQSVSSGTTVADYIAVGLTFALNTFYHIALIRRGTVFHITVDGLLSSLVTNTSIGSNALPTLTSVFVLGARQLAGVYDIPLLGWLDEVRISNGIARWPNAFIPPSYPYGFVVTSTRQFKFGTASMYLDGSTNVSLADSTDWALGTSDFTIDGWVYFYIVGGGYINGIFQQYVDVNNSMAAYTTSGGGWSLLLTSSGVQYQIASTNLGDNPNINTWYHFAFVRASGSCKLYINGVSVAISDTITTNSIPDFATTLELGRLTNSSESFCMNGFIEEFRWSKGIARWVANFTVPSLPYDGFNASNPLVGFSVVDFPNASSNHQQVVHFGTSVFAYDRVTSSNITLRNGAPFIRSFNAKVGAFLIQTYQDRSAPFYWDGITASMAVLSGNAPGFKRAIEFQGYLIGMNVAGAMTRCYYQPIGNLIGGGAAYTDFFTLTPAPSDDETSDAFLLNGRLYVGTKYSIFRVSFVGGVTVFEFKQVISDVGVVPGTAQIVVTKEFGQVCLFLGTDKRIYMFDGANVKTISDLYFYHNKSTPIAMDLIDDNYKENAFAVYDTTKRIYRLFITKKASSSNYYSMNVDVDTFAYYPFDNMHYSSGCMAFDSLLRPFLVCADYAGVLHQMFIDTSTDTGIPINEYYTSPLVSIKSNLIKKGVTINIDQYPTSSANLEVADKIDFNHGWNVRQKLPCAASRDKFLGQSFVLGSSKLGSDKDIITSHIDIKSTFNNYQFMLSSDTSTAPAWEILDMIVDQEVLKFGKSEAQR